MNTAELKLDLINRISQIKEIRIIENLQKFLDFEMNESTYQTSDTQKQRIF